MCVCVCVCVVECKIELTFVKLGAAYYGIVDVGTNVRKIRRRVLRYVAVDDKYRKIAGRCNNKVGSLPLAN